MYMDISEVNEGLFRVMSGWNINDYVVLIEHFLSP